MDATDVAARYFAAWNARDRGRRGGGLRRGRDATATRASRRGSTPPGRAAYAAGLWTAFPDLAFAVDDVDGGRRAAVWARWTMTGTDTGGLRGLPPTGRADRAAPGRT